MAELSKAELNRLIEKGFNARDIAEICGCSPATVRRRARTWGLTVRRHHQPEKLLRMYRELGSIEAVGSKLGLTGSAVSRILRQHVPGYAGSKSGVRYTDEDREKALQMYIDEVPIDSICAELGCSRSTVTVWAARDGVGRGAGRRRSYEPQEAAELYEKLGTLKDVAEVLGVSISSVGRALQEVTPC